MDERRKGHIMTRARIEAILAGTKGVTPGPWTVGSWRDYVYSIAGENKWEPICRVQRNGDEATDDNRDVIDAAHIARLDPQTVSALCTALLENMDRVEELEFGLAAAVQIAGEAAEEWDKAPEGMRAGKILLALAGHRPRYRPDTDAIHATLAARKSLGGSNER